MQFQSGPYYAWYIKANFATGIRLPPELESCTTHFGQLNLLGREITPERIELLLSQVHKGTVSNLYISPFVPDGQGDLSYSRELHGQLLYGMYSYGCGAAGLNQEQSVAVFRKLDKYILDQHRPLRVGDRALPQPPVIFESFRDMTGAVGNIILTGSLNGTRKIPPAVSPSRRGVDPGLLFWIENVLGEVPKSPADLHKVTGLVSEYYVRGYPEFPDWLAPEPGNWSLLGELPNLKVLFMPELTLESYDFLLKCPNLERVGLSRTNLSDSHALENLPNVTFLDLPPADFDDFSFLLKCHSLEILDVSRTNFRDCSILTKTPALKRVLLPAERQLLHLELLDPLPIQVKPDPSRVRGKGFPSYELMNPHPVEPWDAIPPYKVLHIDIDDEGSRWEGSGITQKVVENLIKTIKKGKFNSLTLSLEYWGEDENMRLEKSGDGVRLSFSDAEKPFEFCLYDPEHPTDWNEILQEVYAEECDEYDTANLDLAAECVLYFIKTGKLYPGAHWAKYYH